MDAAAVPIMAGQVCDRCRRRKIKCDGRRPKCSKCITANVECLISATLLRRTKPRGYVDDTPQRMAELETTVIALQKEIAEAAAREEQLRIHLLQAEDRLENHKRSMGRQQSFSETIASDTRAAWPRPTASSHNRADEPILGHIGQLLPNEYGQEVFLGAHTGVHFLSSAARNARDSLGDQATFPVEIFQLFFTQQSSPFFFNHDLQPLAGWTLETIQAEVQRFCTFWTPVYPVLERETILGHSRRLLTSDTPEVATGPEAVCLAFQLHAIQAVNHIASPDRKATATPPIQRLAMLFSSVCEIGGLEGLRGLLLYTLAMQLEGRSLLATQANGIIVRLAQSLGLHRHSRRFKQEPSQVEIRRRLWWCVFLNDTNTSIHQGLPRLIRPADVDVDVSVNEDVADHSIQQLPIIPPGASATSMSLFRQQITLYQILSEVLDQLYTTWSRRNGVGKIRYLEEKLWNWRRSLDRSRSNTTASEALPTSTEDYYMTRLLILAEFANLLIHRPALTFPHHEPQFEISLTRSVVSAEILLNTIYECRLSWLMLRTWPFGASTVFQLGLVVLYPFWIRADWACADHDTVRHYVVTTSNLLQLLQNHDTASLSSDGVSPTITALESLCTKTLSRAQSGPQQSADAYTQQSSADGTGAEQPNILDELNFMDWQSLMLPNDFLFSDIDLLRSFQD